VTTVFLDTVGLLALWDRSDQWHARAEAAYEKIVRERAVVITTTFVLLECGNAAARRPYRSAVAELRQSLEAANRLAAPTTGDWQEAWAEYQRDQADRAGIVDHVSFRVMNRLGVSDALTNDRHFVAAGFRPLF